MKRDWQRERAKLKGKFHLARSGLHGPETPGPANFIRVVAASRRYS